MPLPLHLPWVLLRSPRDVPPRPFTAPAGGMPSGHTAVATFLALSGAGILAMVLHRAEWHGRPILAAQMCGALVAVLLVALVACDRVLSRCHTPAQAWAGVGVGLLFTGMVAAIDL